MDAPKMKMAKTARCSSCRWWERSNNFRAVERDWGLCHLFGGKSGRLTALGFIDYSFGHEPRGSNTCSHHNADPSKKDDIIMSGEMPQLMLEGEFTDTPPSSSHP